MPVWRAGDPTTTEKYWQLLELMRQEFLADIAEYYKCMAPNIAGMQQPAYASKLAKMKSVIQRLSVSSHDGICAHLLEPFPWSGIV
jgi:hypothetical protein